MSLIDYYAENCIRMTESTVADGLGGVVKTWTEGETLTAAITLDTSTQAKMAEKQGVSELYTITTKKDINLQFHDVIKRVSDGKVFRITSNGDDKHTPSIASLNMRQVSAEEWRLD